MNQTIFEEAIAEHLSVIESIKGIRTDVERIGKKLSEVLRNGGKIMFCGNGGSAADSQHLAAELTGRFKKDRVPLAGLALSTDSSALTCISNDYSFDEVFARQVRGIGRAGDALVGISTSGNSPNVQKAVIEGNRIGIFTVGLLGNNGGALAQLCSTNITVESSSTARVQEAHILVGHILCALIEEKLDV
jgi:D-sedoheptulose 7-phosphate isomerase